MTTAAIMTADVVGHADGGDHRVEREHDVEQHDLHDDRGERRRDPRADVALLAFELVVNLVRRLGDQEQAADEQDQIAARELVAETTVKSGAVSRMIQVSDSSSSDAHDHRRHRPMRRARSCCSAGSLPARIEMKMTLSMPSTISSTRQRDERDQSVCGQECIHG